MFGSMAPGFMQMPAAPPVNDPSLGGMLPQLLKMSLANPQQQPQRPGVPGATPQAPGGLIGLLQGLFKRQPGAPLDLAAPGMPSNVTPVPNIPAATADAAPGPNQLTGMW